MTRRRATHGMPDGDLLVMIRERAERLPQAQQQVAAAVLEDPPFAVRANVDEIARRAGVSPPTIVRFCRAIADHGEQIAVRHDVRCAAPRQRTHPARLRRRFESHR